MESQEELLERTDKRYRQWFDWKFPIWECPKCKHINRYAADFFEVCEGCREDHTLD